MQLVEMLFEMNYDSGHWRRLKRTRVVSKHGASSTPGQKTTWFVTRLRNTVNVGQLNYVPVLKALFQVDARESLQGERGKRNREDCDLFTPFIVEAYFASIR